MSSAELDRMFGDKGGDPGATGAGDPDKGQSTEGKSPEELLLEVKFKDKTPAEIAKAYHELETKLGADAEERRTAKLELQQIREELQAQRAAATAAQALQQKPGETKQEWFERLMDPTRSQEAVASLLTAEVDRKLQPLQQMIGKLYWQNQWTEARMATRGDIDKYRTQIDELFRINPALANMDGAYLKVYKMFRADGAEASIQQQIEAAKKDAEKAILDKLAGRTPGTGGAGRKESDNESDPKKLDEFLFGKEEGSDWS